MNLPQLQYPTYETKLISKELNVTFRPFLVKEHKILMTLQNADAHEIARIIKTLVDVCTFQKLDVDKLPYFDIEYLFLQIRAKSIGESVDVNIKCECGNKIKTSYNIEDVIIDKNEKHTSKIQLDENCGLIMKYPSIDKAVTVFETNDQELIDDLIITSIEAIYDKENYWDSSTLDKQDIQNFIDNLQKNHFDLIEDFFITSPQIVQAINVECEKCNTKIEAKLKGLYNFFV